ncbi:hypothetical protein IAR55_004095 [Kwoniella newhampshirensis]|uniref:Uncharacterized protein n=1 Tax=Kwoniella newhampshirensis TaxID=1651941 RepID=A0AAW0YYY6_9TREE
MGRTTPLALLLAVTPLVHATHLSDSLLNRVYNVMNQVSVHSWENGTKAEAILEATYPSLSVFSPTDPVPLPSGLSSGQVGQIIDVAQTTMSNRPATNLSAHGGSRLLNDGAAGDPASLGITIMIASTATGNAQVNGVSYGDAVNTELNYILYDVPRTTAGAISHRADQAQLWSDSVYMVPPFLAYYGAVNNNQTLIQIAYQQCSLYRNALRQSNGLWYHIVDGTGTSDPNPWATGNAWAAAGMLRVWATIRWSDYASQMSSQMNDLQGWITEIFDAAQGYTSDGLLRNYITDSSSFEDTSGTALFAATGLRLSTLNITNNYVNTSLNMLSALSTHVNSTGYLTQVVNPNDFTKQGDHSPEGQSFVVMAYAAYKEWDALGRAGAPGGGGGDPLGQSSGARMRVVSVGMGLVLAFAGIIGWVTI